MLMQFDFQRLRKDPKTRYYFRYPLHRTDFHEVRSEDRLLGYYYAKPLYGRVTEKGEIDKSQGYNGDIAAIFLKSPVRSEDVAVLLFDHTSPDELLTKDGRRNWEKINRIAEKRIRKYLEVH